MVRVRPVGGEGVSKGEKIQESKKMKEQVRTQVAKGVLPNGGEGLAVSIIKYRSRKREIKLQHKRAAAKS